MLRSPLGLILAVLGLTLAAVGPAQAAPMAADLDRDGVFDDLERGVRGADPQRTVRVIVTLEANATRERTGRIERHVESLDVTRRFGVVDAFSATVDAGAVRELAAQPGVAHVERDAPVHATNASAQEWFGVAAAKADPDVPGLDGDGDGAPASYSKDDLVAAVIDTGIDADHVALDGGKVLAFQDFTDFDHSDFDTPIDDDLLIGHGTHVAATIAGDDFGDPDGEGVAPGAGLVGLKVLGPDGKGSTTNVIAAIDWVWNPAKGETPGVANGVTYGIEAINLSLGGTGCVDGRDAASTAVNNAAAAGYVVAVSAGNDGPEGCVEANPNPDPALNVEGSGISSPAAAADAITVGAMADAGEGGFYLAGFSSRGPTLDGRIKPDISAPGVDIRSARAGTASEYRELDGTSMAAPFVTGVALLMRDLNPSLTAAAVKRTIMQTAVDWGSPGPDSDHGAGRLDAYAALAAAKAPTALLSPPPVPSYQRIQSSLATCGTTARSYTVTGSAGVPLTIGLTVTPNTDFDMYLYKDSSPDPVALAETPHRQDELHLSSGADGPYRLEVRSFSGSGAFFLDVSGATATENPPSTAPENTSAPTTAGTGRLGSALVGGPGCWKGDPAFAYEWERCNVDGTDCVGTGDVDTTYQVTSADSRRAMRFVVVATNSVGTRTARGSLIPVVSPPPVNTAPPGLRGEPRAGESLSATPGTWDSPDDTIVRSYVWERCDAGLTACTPVPGGVGADYTPTSDDVGSRIRVVETATNSGGPARASSGATEAIAPALRPPASGGAPAVAGTARHGETLQLTPGTWGGAGPIAFAYEWLRCDGAGVECAPIPGAGADRYSLVAADVGSRIVGRVMASNADGRGQADSAATGVVSAARPASRKRPTVSGRARRGRLLRVHGGTWWGTPALTFRVQWLRCSSEGRGCRAIDSPTRSVYLPRTADIGHRLRARVSAVGPGGSRRATSRATRVVRRIPSPRPALPRRTRRMNVAVADDPVAEPRSLTTRLAAARG